MEQEAINRLAIMALGNVLSFVGSIETHVDGTLVRVTTSKVLDDPRDSKNAAELGLELGEWPRALDARCEWEGGQVEIRLRCTTYRDEGISLNAFVRPNGTTLVWRNLSATLRKGGGSEVVSIPGSYAIRKRRSGRAKELELAKRSLRRLVQDSGMPPMDDGIELFQVDQLGMVLPTVRDAVERIVRLALYKLEFVAIAPQRREESGAPLIETPELTAYLAASDNEGGEESEPDEVTDEEASGRSWLLEGSALDAQGNPPGVGSWNLGWTRDDQRTAAQTDWARFDEVSVGDAVALRINQGDQERIIRIGSVRDIDYLLGTLAITWDRAAAEARIPTEPWTDRIQEVTRQVDLHAIFGDEIDEESGADVELENYNIILYGPPGTGKTWTLRDRYFPKFRAKAQVQQPDVNLETLAELSWYHVIGATLYDLGGTAAVGAIKEHPWITTKKRINPFRSPLGSRVWSTLQGHTVESSKVVKLARRHGELVFDKREDSTWYFPGGPSEAIVDAAESIRILGEHTDRFRFVTFHQSYGYEDFIEGIRPITVEDDSGETSLAYERRDGVFLKAVREAIGLTGFEGSVHEFCSELTREQREEFLRGAPRCAVFIDEINRGNVARIFGELITLIESTKRLGLKEELIVTLPTSGDRFGVPSNLYLIGTMNTADRSVEALDTALRRRFAFEECPPRPELLDFVVEGGIRPRRMLEAINARLLKLLDRDHLIGHAHFMPLREDRSFDRLQSIFEHSILPLLQEYFYGDWGRIGLVLGKAFVRRHGHEHVSFADFEHDDHATLSDRPTYECVALSEISGAAYRRIYEDDATDTAGY